MLLAEPQHQSLLFWINRVAIPSEFDLWCRCRRSSSTQKSERIDLIYFTRQYLVLCCRPLAKTIICNFFGSSEKYAHECQLKLNTANIFKMLPSCTKLTTWRTNFKSVQSGKLPGILTCEQRMITKYSSNHSTYQSQTNNYQHILDRRHI
mgnify:CR=1 FL=1